MRKFPSILKTASSVLALAGSLALSPTGSMAAEGGGASATEQGKAIAFDRKKGNCLACHAMPIPEEPFHGTVGPPLAAVGARLSAVTVAAGKLFVAAVDEHRVCALDAETGFDLTGHHPVLHHGAGRRHDRERRPVRLRLRHAR